jgi:uncharacterized membrane protein YqjE
MASASINRSIPDVFRDLVSQLTTLLRKEAQLARAEVSEKIGQATTALVLLILGAVLLMPALVVLLNAVVAALIDSGMRVYWAAALVGGAALLIGLALLAIGIFRLKAKNLVPSKTIEQLQRDASAAKYQMRSNHEIQSAA